MKIGRVLTIAGSDAGGGAGIQGDLKTFAALGVYGSSVITAVTAQNTRGVTRVAGIDAEMVASQLDAVWLDIGADAAKTGMLFDEKVVEAVVDRLSCYKLPCLVVDPVMIATSGAQLLSSPGQELLRDRLIPLASFITPNCAEAAALCGFEIGDSQDLCRAARDLHARGAGFVVITGVNIDGKSLDFCFDGQETGRIVGPRIECSCTHGTGCAFSAALAAFAAQGASAWSAVALAKKYVANCLHHGYQIGAGIGPLNHMATFYPGVLTDCEIAEIRAHSYRKWGGRSQLKALPVLNLIIGGPICKGQDHAILASHAARNGVGMIQLREKSWETKQLIETAQKMLAICRPHGTLLIVNDRVDVALAADADGVHLGQTDLDPRMARSILGPGKIIGVSASSVVEAIAAEARGADYLGVLAYPSNSKDCPYEAGGPDLLKKIAAEVEIPVIAIGGITPENTTPLLAAGASGVAVISAILGSNDPIAAMRQFRKVLKPDEEHDMSVNFPSHEEQIDTDLMI
ncbi:MAG: bifunctional hydroxymethylpyrimidine kinase/phosphomethylpyrimidine kinase [Syntrophomonadaceae bacterium]